MATYGNRVGSERRIFFPWEGRRGLRRFLVLGRVGPALLFAVALGFVFWVAARERGMAGERKTRVALTEVRGGVERYLAEHEGGCPEHLEQVLPYLKKAALPRDAWGRPFRLVCPAERPGRGYVLMSDGPDLEPGGLDRIEF